ncbi:MAG: hypothetical protein WKF71_15430 [Pyrinomonadaceae bacterium]
MKSHFFLTAFITAFILFSSTLGQEVELTKLLDETQAVAKKTGYQYFIEFTHNFKTTVETKNGKKLIKEYERVCSKKRCEIILISDKGKTFSVEKIKKSREKAAKRLIEAEKMTENPYLTNDETRYGYGFSINTYFSPNLYLKYCKTGFIDKTILQNRSTIKVSVTDCNADALSTPTNFRKDSLHFMAKTEGFVWIDEKDKAVVKMELFASKKFDNSASPHKTLIIMEAARIPEGYWFWKRVKVNALENKIIFPEYVSNWQVDFYDYKSSLVEVKASVDKK